jgi:heme-degrading monooxygenase HmoA
MDDFSGTFDYQCSVTAGAAEAAEAASRLRRRPGPADDGGVITIITPFEVPDGDEASFTDAWKALSAVAARLPGYRAARLHRSRGRNARFPFIGISIWDSEQSVTAALADPAFAAAFAAIDCPSHPSVYDVAVEIAREP